MKYSFYKWCTDKRQDDAEVPDTIPKGGDSCYTTDPAIIGKRKEALIPQPPPSVAGADLQWGQKNFEFAVQKYKYIA
jgi:hypothetical protein